MNQSLKRLYDLIERTISAIGYSLEKKSKKQNFKWAVNSGLTKTDSGGLGFVSCFPNGFSTEDSLDGIFEIHESEGMLKIVCGIYWSNGKVVAEIGELELYGNDGNAQIGEFNKLEETITEIFFKTLSEIM
jgi:hypothetical protein